MQRGGTDIRASVLQAQSKSTNSYFLQFATSKPRAFRTYSENYLQSVFSRNYLTPSSYFVYYTKNQWQILQVLSNKSVSCYLSSSEHRFILICVTRPLVAFHFPNDIDSSLVWNTNTPLVKNFRVTMQVKQMPFSLFLLVLGLLVLLGLFFPSFRTSQVESMAKQWSWARAAFLMFPTA